MNKVCKSCGIEKPKEDFYFHSKSKNTLRTNCKECHIKLTTTSRQQVEREYSLKQKYNLSIKDYNSLLLKQNGLCLICESHQDEELSHFVVDHDHRTEEVRGLLCPSCNIGLGMFKDNINTLEGAIKYLKKLT